MCGYVGCVCVDVWVGGRVGGWVGAWGRVGMGRVGYWVGGWAGGCVVWGGGQAFFNRENCPTEKYRTYTQRSIWPWMGTRTRAI